MVGGKLGVHEDKLYIELHNFDFKSSNAIQYMNHSLLLHNLWSLKRNSCYTKRMTEISDSTQRTKRQRTSDNAASDDNTSSRQIINLLPVQATQIKLSIFKNAKQPVKRELHSSNTAVLPYSPELILLFLCVFFQV